MNTSTWLALCVCVTQACSGKFSSPEGTGWLFGEDGRPPGSSESGALGSEAYPADPFYEVKTGAPSTKGALSSSNLRLLSNQELRLSLLDLTGTEPVSLALLPSDSSGFLFDRVVNGQTMSEAYMDAVSEIAGEVSETLLQNKGLDLLSNTCPDSVIPPPPAMTAEVAGGAMAGQPDWSITCSSASDICLQYYGSGGGDLEVSYSHEFATPGRYTVGAVLEVGGSMTLNAFVDNVATRSASVGGSQTFEFNVDIATAGPHAIKYTSGAAGTRIAFKLLRITGPVQTGGGGSASERQACADGLIDGFAWRAFRRPLSHTQRDALAALYAQGDEDGFWSGIRMLLQGIIQNPHFLYVVELGTQTETVETAYRLDSWEVAARLSYGLCERAPDEILRAKAEAGELVTREQVRAEAARLFELPCARESVRRFFRQWLGMDLLARLAKDPTAYPTFNEQMRAGMYAELDRFADKLVFEQSGSFVDLFTSTKFWPSATTRSVYGLPEGADGAEAEMPAERKGVLGHAGILALTSHQNGTSPVKRGLFLLERILCEELPPPPADVDLTPPEESSVLTTRERWELHSSSAACSGCHSRIDPLGFTQEIYDGIGRYRPTEHGLPVDASGAVHSFGGDVITGGAELSTRLAQSQQARECFARQWMRYTLGRVEDEDDPTGSIGRIVTALEAGNLKEAFIEVSTTQAFVHRYGGTAE